MNQRRCTQLYVLAALAGGCSAEDQRPVPIEDVLRLAVCQEDVGCDGSTMGVGVADGKTSLRLEVLTPVNENRRSDMPVTIAATAGRFAIPSTLKETETVLDIGRAGRAEVLWIPGTELGLVRFEATWSGFRSRADAVLSGAPIGALEMTPNPIFARADQGVTITLTVVVRGRDGASPSKGTLVMVRAESDAPAEVAAYPADSEIDGNFTVRPVVALPATAQATRLIVTAIPPGDSSGALSSSVLIQRQ